MEVNVVKKTPPAPVPEGHRYCFSCETLKTIDQFGKHRRSRDGYYSLCRPCARASTARSRELRQLVRETADRIQSSAATRPAIALQEIAVALP